MRSTSIITFLALVFLARAQYAPPASQVGTTAVAKDSNIIRSWATEVVDFNRGYKDLNDTTLGWATFGDSTEALGMAEGNSTNVVSLGDGGAITLKLPYAVFNGPGADFVVFENSFDETFLELAFVEVSTDGFTFVRFPAYSLTDDSQEIGTFGSLDATKIHNLAGKYKQGYGTPFDLEDIKDSIGIDVNDIHFIRIVDVVGTTRTEFATYDSQGHVVIDPYPTPFDNGGFDLDGVGTIHEDSDVSVNQIDEFVVRVFPNPAQSVLMIEVSQLTTAELFDMNGRLVWSNTFLGLMPVDLTTLLNGLYLLKLTGPTGVTTKKVMVEH